MGRLKPFLVVTDVGFIVYWSVVALGVVPGRYFFAEYGDPIMEAWNWSFLPLDLLVSATGLISLYLHRGGSSAWRNVALVSLVLTSCAGLQAISFWAIRGDFDPAWWLPNLFLLIYPLFFIAGFVRSDLGSGARV